MPEAPAAGPKAAPAPAAPDEAVRLRDLLAAQESKSATLEYHLKQARTAVDDARREATGAAARAGVLETMEVPQTPAESLNAPFGAGGAAGAEAVRSSLKSSALLASGMTAPQ